MAKKASKQHSQNQNDNEKKSQNSGAVVPTFPSIASKVNLPSNVLLTDQIILLDNFLSTSECQAFVKMMEALPLELTPPKKRGEAERVNCGSLFACIGVRDDWTGIPDRFSVQSPAFSQKLFALLLPHLPPLDTGSSTNRQPISCNSNIRMYKYTPSQHFGPHYDDSVVDPANGARSEWTVLVYLSGVEDGVEGGETLFYKTEKRKPSDTITAPLTRGTALLHRPYVFSVNIIRLSAKCVPAKGGNSL
ncbi:hypothetical protein V5O48_001780 [Marasmius crinis-equi]|uniref:Prolyl 4-hydroxylase alpha subunit domain-containing protein n=1 Tax=Marasmius crinis-equi TaxID=585013 RepID=A0ABR3FXN3_9AGAR